jgi:hypothetical protein
MKYTRAALVIAGALAFAAGCGSPRPSGGHVSREDINTVKFEIDVLQYLLQQTKPTGINITDADWKPASRELLVTLTAPGMQHQMIEYDTLATVMNTSFFRRRFAKTDHIRIQLIGTDGKMFKEYVDFDKFAKQ